MYSYKPLLNDGRCFHLYFFADEGVQKEIIIISDDDVDLEEDVLHVLSHGTDFFNDAFIVPDTDFEEEYGEQKDQKAMAMDEDISVIMDTDDEQQRQYEDYQCTLSGKKNFWKNCLLLKSVKAFLRIFLIHFFHFFKNN